MKLAAAILALAFLAEVIQTNTGTTYSKKQPSDGRDATEYSEYEESYVLSDFSNCDLGNTLSQTVITLGAIGAGKSTISRVISSFGMIDQREKFKAAPDYEGVTQQFSYVCVPIYEHGIIKLYDSPGMSDPKIPINQWLNLYNNAIGQSNEKINLIVLVIEHVTRPSLKEKQLFVFLNQAFSQIKENNVMIILNHAKKNMKQERALEFYETCIKSAIEDKGVSQRNLPQLKAEDFLILEEIELSLDCEKEDAVECQRLVEYKIQKKVRPFFEKKLLMAQQDFYAKLADNEKIRKQLLDKASQDEIAELQNQQKQFEENKPKYKEKIEEQYKELNSLQSEAEFWQIMATLASFAGVASIGFAAGVSLAAGYTPLNYMFFQPGPVYQSASAFALL